MSLLSSGPLVDREREVELLVAGLDSGAHVLLEGPPGTGKTTLLRSVARSEGLPFVFVEGNAELTPARLIGSFDPALVLSEGYRPDSFIDGPLLEAMRRGALLYVEEINRIPEETLNVLITVMSEAELTVPRLGPVPAEAGFRLIAAMNPFDAVGTARISSAIYDRVCLITMGYQSAGAELDVVISRAPEMPVEWRRCAVDLVRRTRQHPDVRVGSSVRGAIDLTGLTVALAARRGLPATDWDVGLDAALVALSARVRLHESTTRDVAAVIQELYEAVFGPRPRSREESEQAAEDDGGGAPGGARAR